MKTARATHFSRKPVLINLIDSAMSTGIYKADLSFDKILNKAIRKTGQKDLGDFWDEPLRKLLYSMETEARLSAIGRFMMQQRLMNLFISRLMAEYWFRKHPEILEQEMYPSWVIVGLQRTGTTKLQRLLGADPDNRSLLSWEALNPAPLNQDWENKDSRPAKGKLSQNALKTISPSFFAIHPVEYQSPEEDILLLDQSFMSTTAEATMHVPSYASWLESVDNTPAYEYEVRLLKLLQWQNPAKRWILKSPHHLEFMDVITKVQPDAQFIWTHREVSECIPSFVSMAAHAWAIFSNDVNLEEVRTHWVRKIKYMLDKGLDYRESPSGKGNIIDINYDSLVENSVLTVQEKIYANQKFDPELKSLFEKANRKNPAYKYGKHHYTLNDVGIEKDSLEKDFSRYLTYFHELKT